MSEDDAAANRKYEDWPVEGDRHDEARFVGVSQVKGGGAWFYNDDDDALFETDVDQANRRLTPSGDERSVSAGESVGEAVERLGDELGWESLSEFAREHLESSE